MSRDGSRHRVPERNRQCDRTMCPACRRYGILAFFGEARCDGNAALGQSLRYLWRSSEMEQALRHRSSSAHIVVGFGQNRKPSMSDREPRTSTDRNCGSSSGISRRSSRTGESAGCGAREDRSGPQSAETERKRRPEGERESLCPIYLSFLSSKRLCRLDRR